MKQFNNKSFTLIEIMVAVAIIAIISGSVVVSVSGYRMKARDAKRISDLKQLQNVLETYFTSFGKYPSNFGRLKIDLGLDSLPNDPFRNTNRAQSAFWSYVYVRACKNPNTSCDINGVDKEAYILAARLEDGDSAILKNMPTAALYGVIGPGNETAAFYPPKKITFWENIFEIFKIQNAQAFSLIELNNIMEMISSLTIPANITCGKDGNLNVGGNNYRGNFYCILFR